MGRVAGWQAAGTGGRGAFGAGRSPRRAPGQAAPLQAAAAGQGCCCHGGACWGAGGLVPRWRPSAEEEGREGGRGRCQAAVQAECRAGGGAVSPKYSAPHGRMGRVAPSKAQRPPRPQSTAPASQTSSGSGDPARQPFAPPAAARGASGRVNGPSGPHTRSLSQSGCPQRRRVSRGGWAGLPRPCAPRQTAVETTGSRIGAPPTCRQGSAAPRSQGRLPPQPAAKEACPFGRWLPGTQPTQLHITLWRAARLRAAGCACRVWPRLPFHPPVWNLAIRNPEAL